MRHLIAVAAGLASLLAASAAGAQAPTGPRTETGSSGAVGVTLTYVVQQYEQAGDVRVAITRDGVPAAADGDLSRMCGGCESAIPVGALGDGSQSSIRFADLAGDGQPVILVDLFTGGAHCCSLTALFGWDPAAGRYRRVVRNWGDPSYAIQKLPGGGLGLVSADDRFAYRFCAYACSAMPIEVLRYRAFALRDVTRQVPALVRRDLRRLRGGMRAARRPHQPGGAVKGILPALCADLYLLGRGPACRRELDGALRRGELRHEAGDLAASGPTYVRNVLRFLRRTGYRR